MCHPLLVRKGPTNQLESVVHTVTPEHPRYFLSSQSQLKLGHTPFSSPLSKFPYPPLYIQTLSSTTSQIISTQIPNYSLSLSEFLEIQELGFPILVQQTHPHHSNHEFHVQFFRCFVRRGLGPDRQGLLSYFAAAEEFWFFQ